MIHHASIKKIEWWRVLKATVLLNDLQWVGTLKIFKFKFVPIDYQNLIDWSSIIEQALTSDIPKKINLSVYLRRKN